MSAFAAAAQDEDGDTINGLKAANAYLLDCNRGWVELAIRLRTRVNELEEMLAAQDEDGDTISALRAENEMLRQSLLTANDTLQKVARAGACHAQAAECLRETVIRWANRAEQAEDMLEAIGAGGVGKLGQQQAVQDPVAEVIESHVHACLDGRFTAEVASRERLSVGAELFVHPQNLRCKSTQARLATLWGYVKEQPPRRPMSEAELYSVASEYFADHWAQRRAVQMLQDHGIGGGA